MRHLLPIGLAALLSACNAADEAPAPASETTASGASDEAASATATAMPGEYAETAWRATSEDGARYTTYLDRDGTYRDLRNGDPWQTGQWTFNSTGEQRLCFTPDAEDGAERCWTPQSMQGDTMVATGGGDRRIELTRIDYQLPDTDSSADE